MKGIELVLLRYLSEKKEDATVPFKPGLNVICGSSDTGKSYIAETLDFMLGGENPPREIPEAIGYSSIELTLKIQDEGWFLLKRASQGGDSLLFESNEEGEKIKEIRKLGQKFHYGSKDSLSAWLLERIESYGKMVLWSKGKGTKRGLSFRDFARLTIIQETEINLRLSPFLSGQYTQGTGEKSVLKYILTGIDDNEQVLALAKIESTASLPKVELIDEWVANIDREINNLITPKIESNPSVDFIDEKILAIQADIESEKQSIEELKTSINGKLLNRRDIVIEIEPIKDRLSEIQELKPRFDLLDRHYTSDLDRLEAIINSGTLIVYEGSSICPLCGAQANHQNTDTDCDANFDEIVKAAEVEMNKIHSLIAELKITIESLDSEEELLIGKISELESNLVTIESDVSVALSKQLEETRDSYSSLVDEKQDLQGLKNLIIRKDNLLKQRVEFLPTESVTIEKTVQPEATLSDSKLNEFAQLVEETLKSWNYPNPNRVHFDKKSFDFVIDGVPRGNRGQGFRAITHAAVSCSLLKYCMNNQLPHPRFLILDSPLLAYYAPEGDQDSLVGTDLKEKFYKNLSDDFTESQVIVIENEHPDPNLVNFNQIVFTRNTENGRFGLFSNS